MSRIKFFELFLPVILLVGFFMPFTHALSINIDVSGIINAVNGNTQSNANAMTDTKDTLNNSLLGLPIDIFGVFKDSVKNALTNFNNSLLDLIRDLLSSNPDPASMFSWWQTIVTIISAFYLLIFLIIGLQFLLSGNNIEKREQAKNWLKNAVIMVIAVNLSFYAYQLILELSSGITQFLWVSGFSQFLDSTMFAGSTIMLLTVFLGSTGLALITLFLRYLFLLAGVALFPIGIFLYLTPKLENWGKIIFNFLGVMLAIQLVDIITLVATQQVMTQLAGNSGAGLILPLGFLVIAIVNSAMMIYAIVKSAFSIANNAPVLMMAINTISGNIAGLAGSAAKVSTEASG